MKLCPKCQKQFSDDANFCPVDAARLVPFESQTVDVDSIAAKFDLGDRLGGSRTGTIYRATDKATGHAVVVKIIAPAVLALPGLAQRLERELKQLERVQSAGVAKVLASGRRGEDSWVALDLLEGAQTLADAIAARGPIPLDQAAHLIEVVGEALIEAAQVGVVHRDLAPKNILFAGAEIKLINFSLPVPANEKVNEKANEKVPGVPAFIAPEQYDGKPVDQRSNLYGLGALYYFVLTGQPVQVDDAGTIRAPSSLAAVPGPVEAVIMRALDKSPTKRFLTVRQFVDEVGRVARGERGEIDGKAAAAMGRPGRPKAELVQTLLGMRAIGGIAAAPASSAPPVTSAPAASSTIIGMIASSAGAASLAPVAGSTIGATVGAGPSPQPSYAGHPSYAAPEMPAPLPPQAVSPDRSPWAPPSNLGPQRQAAVQPAAPVVAAPVVASPTAAPILAAPAGVPAQPLAPTRGASSSKNANQSGDDAKGTFRETVWFKKGELDAQAAHAAAEERARTGRDAATDKADSLPIDERYKDDGSLSRSDREKYSLRTGATMMTAARRDSRASASLGRVSEDSLIDEMKGGRNRIFAAIAIGLVAIALIVFLLVR